MSFALGEDLLAVELSAVRTIRALGAVTRLPGAPPTVRGLTGVEGAVVPVVDLTSCLGRPPILLSSFTALVVVQRGGALAALAADQVLDTVMLGPRQSSPAGDCAGLLGRAVPHPGEPGRMLLLVTEDDVARAAGLAGPGRRGGGT